MPAPFFKKNLPNKIAKIIRVDHAGEYGAQRIYQGQIDYSSNKENKTLLKSMLAHEEIHLKFFANELINKNINPTIFIGIWHYLGYLLGAISATMGIKEAMMVTSAIEEVIEQHYLEQLKILELIPDCQELKLNIASFMEEEVHHKFIADKYLVNQSTSINFCQKIIRNICSFAIFFSEKI